MQMTAAWQYNVGLTSYFASPNPSTRRCSSCDDGWEPLSSHIEGAESILDAYIDKAARQGNVVLEDGARRKSKVAKLKADRPPSSKDSSKESSSKRKKRESAAAV